MPNGHVCSAVARDEFVPLHPYGPRAFAAALAVALVYYAGAKIGFALTFAPYPISVLWPPNALLLAALVLAPGRWWWLLIAAAFPAHLIAEMQANVPSAMVFCWFLSNVSEALIGALFMRYFGMSLRLDEVHAVIVFCGGAVFAAFLSSFLDAGFVRLVGWGEVDYWELWRSRFLTNTVAMLTFVPVVITLAAAGHRGFRAPAPMRLLEGGALLAGLVACSIIAFDSGLSSHGASPAFIYLPLPFLLWAALRFGPPSSTLCFSVVAFLVIWGAGHGLGPFHQDTIISGALPIQLFLISVGVPLLVLVAVIEERRRAEAMLRTSEARFATAFRSSPDAMAISRRSDGRILDVNDRWRALLGYESDAGECRPVAPLAAHADERDRARIVALASGAENVRDLEIALRDCHGNARQVLVSVEAAVLDAVACQITIIRDVTEQRRTELEAREQRRQLTHLTRIASLTDFSGALAHELNQPLTAILSNAQAAERLLESEAPDLSEIRTILSEIAEADKRAALVIDRLRLMMKKGEENFQRIDLNQVVSEALDFAHSEFVIRNVEVGASFSADLPAVRGDRVQLQQLVLNLVANACEAMQGGDGPEKQLEVTTTQTTDGTVRLIVTDSGPGIPADRCEAVFEPFYTTKAKGLGLGLSICRTIATIHGGTLTAQTRSRGGARFELMLPPAELVRPNTP